ncbi:unnamed protein product [marine sediment metagenome]|uniref:Uncharacterized protein n=1 Tax=marine sediment metagenome TaxID=412755 RepID=X1B0Q6_9ZZZZ
MKLNTEQLKHEIADAIADLSRYELIKIKLGDSIDLGKFYPLGAVIEMNYFAFKCNSHGIVADYKQNMGELRCPICLNENWR